MSRVVLWDTACNFNAVILNQSIFHCLITSASTLLCFNTLQKRAKIGQTMLNQTVLALLYKPCWRFASSFQLNNCLHCQTNGAEPCWPTKKCQCKLSTNRQVVIMKNLNRNIMYKHTLKHSVIIIHVLYTIRFP